MSGASDDEGAFDLRQPFREPPPWVGIEQSITRTLDAEARRLIPGEVASALEEAFRTPYEESFNVAGRGDPYFVAWLHRNGVVADELLPRYRALLPHLELPAGADLVWEEALSISPAHAPFLAALLLRESHRQWWDALPWLPGERRDQWGRPKTHVALLTEEEASESGSPQLVRAVQEGLPYPDLPKTFDLDDHARVLLAAAAVLHTYEPDEGAWRKISVCRICGRQFPVHRLFLTELHLSRSDEFCQPCTADAIYGRQSEWTACRDAGCLSAIRSLTEDAGGPPSRAQLGSPIRAADVEERARQLMLRQVLPNSFYGHSGGWGKLLQRAGVVEGGWRPSYGIYVTASDGHPCRSLSERQIDDFLAKHGIAHAIEPKCPVHETLNLNGLRADWALADGTYVEFAGLLQRDSYREKLDRKRRLAAELGVSLLVIEPAGLGKLEFLFRRWL